MYKLVYMEKGKEVIENSLALIPIVVKFSKLEHATLIQDDGNILISK